MNAILRKLVESANDLGSLAKTMAESGLETVSGAWKNIPLMGSLSVLSREDLERDETHYLLVPRPDQEFTVFTKRILPPDVGAVNSLPKARIFHVPDLAGHKILEEQLLSRALEGSGAPAESELADRLEALADDLDRESRKVSGGLLIIGGAVAFVNPLVGAGIAAQALMPSLSTSAAKAGVSYLGDKMRLSNKARSDGKAKQAAAKEIAKLNPEIYPNALLESLDILFSNESCDFDPFLDPRNRLEDFEEHRYLEVTIEAIRSVFGKDLLQKKATALTGTARAWVLHLSELEMS